MRETGERFVCDRCKKELFISKDESENSCSIELPEGWGFHYKNDREGIDHLCSDCYGTYRVMIADFMALRDIKVVE